MAIVLSISSTRTQIRAEDKAAEWMRELRYALRHCLSSQYAHC